MAERKPFLLRLDPATHDALQRWAADEMRSLNAHIEFLLRDQLKRAGRAGKPNNSSEIEFEGAEDTAVPSEPAGDA